MKARHSFCIFIKTLKNRYKVFNKPVTTNNTYIKKLKKPCLKVPGHIKHFAIC